MLTLHWLQIIHLAARETGKQSVGWVAIYKLKIKVLKWFYLRPAGRKFQGLLKGKARR